MANIRKLGEFHEMIYLREILLNHLIKNSKADKSGLTLRDKKCVLYTLSSHMIKKLFDINHDFITKPNYIYDIINSYINRNSCHMRELQWISLKTIDLPPDFCIQIPEFEPNSLVFLLVNQVASSSYQPGPLINHIRDQKSLIFLDDLSDIMYNDFDSFKDAAKSIGKIIYNRIISKDSAPPKDYESIKAAFYNQNICLQSQSFIIAQMKNLFTIAESLDNWNEHQLLFDDLEFLSTKFLDNQAFLNKYPSLIFWICKNKQCASQIMHNYKDFIPNTNKLPLWVLCLRIFSSKQCITFESRSKGKIYQIINDATVDAIMKYIDNTQKINQMIDYDWINILISNPPTEIMNPNIKIIHDFFNILSLDEDSNANSNEVNYLKYESIKDSIFGITSLILSKKTNELVENEITNNNDLMQFLVSPINSIQKSIDKKFSKIIKFVLSNKLTTDLRNFISDKENFEHIICDLKKAIKADEANIKDIFDIIIQKEKRKIKEATANEIKEKINKYENYISRLEGNGLNFSYIDLNISQLINFQAYLQKYPELFKDEQIVVKKYRISHNSDRYCIKIGTHESKYDQIPIEYPSSAVLHPGSYPTPEYIPILQQTMNFKYLKEEYIDNKNKIIEIIKDKNDFIRQIPYLLFGREGFDSNSYIRIIISLQESLNSFDTNVFNILESDQNINQNVFSFIDNSIKKVNLIRNNLNVKFSDESSAQKTKNILQGNLKTYLDNLFLLLEEFQNLVNTKLYSLWKSLDNNQNIENLLRHDDKYNIELPMINYDKLCIPNFSSIKEIKPLSSPIICLSNDNSKILCSITKLNKLIDPIFPSLTNNNPLSICLLSFIDRKITLSIENSNNIKQFDEIFSTKEKLSNKESIIIKIIPPEIKENEPKSIYLKGIINAKIDDKIQPLSLPFEIKLNLIPLKFRIKCDQYKLIKESCNNNFKLCCNAIESSVNINFEIINYYIHDQDIFAVELEPLHENEADQPSLKKKSKGFNIAIPEVDDTTRCQFNIIIKFSQNFISKILCDFMIIPYVFTFEIYDYLNKCFANNECDIILEHEKTQFLYFRFLTMYPKSYYGKVTINFPDSIEIGNSNITQSYPFLVSEFFYIKIKDKSQYINQINGQFYGISLEIGNIKKTIKINFIYPTKFWIYNIEKLESKIDQYYLSRFPVYIYGNINKKWIKINKYIDFKKEMDGNSQYIIVTPFQVLKNEKKFRKIEYLDENVIAINYLNNEEEYIQITLTKISDKILKTQNTTSSKTKMKIDKETVYYYSIIGYDCNDHNIWFPCFETYPDIFDIKPLPLNVENIENAKENINKMIKSLTDKKLSKIKSIFTSNITDISQKNFVVLLVLLMEDTIILNIKSIIDMFPQNLSCQFTDILRDTQRYIDSIGSLEKIRPIISHNLILKFAKLFQEKYLEIKSKSFYLLSPLTTFEINKKKDAVYDEFVSIDKSIINDKKYAELIFNKYKNETLMLSNDHDLSLSDESQHHESYIICENDDAIPGENLGSFNYDKSENEDLLILNNAEAIKKLPDITLPDKLSISNLNSFYFNCSQGASILPTHVLNCRLNQCSQNESEKYFATLFQIYSEITNKSLNNKSVISHSINKFIESFKNCVQRLKVAGCTFDALKLPKNCLIANNNNYQNYIKMPDIEIPSLTQFPWYIKNQTTNNLKINTDEDIFDFSSDIYIEESEILNSNFSFEINNNDADDNYLNDSNQNASINIISEEEKAVIIEKVVFDDSDDENIKEDDLFTNDNQQYLNFSDVSNSKKIDLNSDKFESLSSQFTELDIIQFVSNRIKTMNKNGRLEFSNLGNYTIQNKKELFKTKQTQFPVKDLIEKSQYLIAKLIAAASDSNCPFLSMSCNLLIDCSSFICIEDKLFNFMLLISFSYALNAIEIPFTISLIADQHFRFVFKTYEEDLTFVSLQRILDCLLIKRYRSNIADTFHHAIQSLHLKERSQRAFFIFSNGLDENLVLTKSWKEMLLNNINNSFGMIFSKSAYLNDPKFDIIEQMWDEFNKIAIKSASITRLIHINTDISPNTLNSVIQIFVDVLSRPENKDNSIQTENKDINPEFLVSCKNFDTNSFKMIYRIFKDDFNDFYLPIYRKINQKFKVSGTIFDNKDIAHYLNKTAKITYSSIDEPIKHNFHFLIHEILYSKRNNYRPFLETIFKPNKASQTILSNTGTDFDITALLLNIINPVPDPLIYLEEKGGLIRNYGVSIIIDSSISCFNLLSSNHSFQTIKVLFSALASIDIPFVDVIIATKDAPIVLCSEIPSLSLFNEKSPFWPSFFNCILHNSSTSCQIHSAVHAAYDLRRMRPIDSTSYMFILSDGLYQKDQKELLTKHIITCTQSGISVFGIGIGIYPNGIKDIFPQVIFSPNPKYLIQGIASCFQDESNDTFDDTINVIHTQKMHSQTIKDVFAQLIKNENNPIFKGLKNYLSNVHIGLDAFSLVYNKESKNKNAGNVLSYQNDEMSEMYVKDLFKGQKILVVMPYDCTMNMKENSKLCIESLKHPDSPNGCCVKDALDFYGIEMIYTQNYKDAINELTRQTEPGKCDYYATWVFSGLPYDYPLADNGNQHLVMQFIHCLLQFWEKGGAVVMLAEGEPLTFQLNLFLQEIRFADDTKTNLRFSGCHKGMKILIGDETGMLDKPGTFNKSPNEFRKYQRSPLGHNLFEIYEGETISYAPDDKLEYYPFIPFMRDSEGGINALFYPGDSDPLHKTGDIFVGGSYSNFFDAITKKGTFRFIQNLAAWTAQYESRFLSMKKNPEKFRPDAIYFDIDESEQFLHFEPIHPTFLHQTVIIDPLKLENNVFAIDNSWSVRNVAFYYDQIKLIIAKYHKNGDKFMIWDRKAEIVSYDQIKKIIEKKSGFFGTYPETIAQKFADDKSLPHNHLIIITDGRVDSNSVKKSDEILKANKIHFKYVTTYIIGKDGDLSVGAPFSRKCGSLTVEITENSRKEIKIDEEDLLSHEEIDNINNVQQFNKIFNSLFNATIKLTIGTKGNAELKEKFEQMEKRILQSDGDITLDVKRNIKALIKMASGAINNIFDSSRIAAMNF